MKNLKDIIFEKLKVNPSKQRLESLEDFDFDTFVNSMDDYESIDVSKYLKDGDPPIMDEYLHSKKYILDHISKLEFSNETSILFVFTLISDPKQTRTWRRSNKEQLEEMTKLLKGGDFLQLLQDIYNDITK